MKQARTFLFLAAVVGGTGFGSLALADSVSPVTYYTEVNNAVNSAGAPIPVTIMSQGNNAELTLTPFSNVGTEGVLPDRFAPLGYVTLTLLHSPTFTDSFNANFDLDIYQVLPGSGEAEFVGAAQGTVKSILNGAPTDTVDISFTPDSFPVVNTIGYTTYTTTYTPFQTFVPVNRPTRITADINQTSTVPVPAAIWGGMGLLGLMGVVKAKRLRRQV